MALLILNLKNMAQIKAMILVDGNLITGEPLKVFLEQIGFTVPAVEPYQPIIIPAYIAPPRNTGDYDAWRTAWLEWKDYTDIRANIMNLAKVENPVRLQAYLQQFEDFADYLSALFVITKNGVETTSYSPLQLANYLMKKQLPDPIHFLSFGYINV